MVQYTDITVNMKIIYYIINSDVENKFFNTGSDIEDEELMNIEKIWYLKILTTFAVKSSRMILSHIIKICFRTPTIWQLGKNNFDR
jgi:hypothetical protein